MRAVSTGGAWDRNGAQLEADGTTGQKRRKLYVCRSDSSRGLGVKGKKKEGFEVVGGPSKGPLVGL